MGAPARATLLVTVELYLLSGCSITLDAVAAEKICLGGVCSTDSTDSLHDLGSVDGNVLSVVLAPWSCRAPCLAAPR
eukprot:4447424-Pyramimonas_sp.AAC.1